MVRIVVVGGGFAGYGASVSARQAGAEVTLVERMDDLLGNGLAGGNIGSNARWTAIEEAKAMGGGLLWEEALEPTLRHKDYDNLVPNSPKHYSTYDVFKAPILAKKALVKIGVNILLQKRAKDVLKTGKLVKGVILDDNTEIQGDALVDASGSIGGTPTCTKYGNGCVMCIIRCPAFGIPISMCKKAGAEETTWKNNNGGIGSMSGAVDIIKSSLSQEFVAELEKKGHLLMPIPKELQDPKKILIKACAQGKLEGYTENLVFFDSGYAKLATPYFELEKLRKIPGFENARYAEPMAAKGNSMRYVSMAFRDDGLKVDNLDNVFAAGERGGPMIGLTEAYITGLLAGHNAVRKSLGKSLLILPKTTLIGNYIKFVGEQMRLPYEKRPTGGYTLAGGSTFKKMETEGLYTMDKSEIKKRIHENNLTNVYKQKLC